MEIRAAALNHPPPPASPPSAALRSVVIVHRKRERKVGGVFFLIIHFLLLVIFSFLLTAVLCTASVFRHARRLKEKTREAASRGAGGKKKTNPFANHLTVLPKKCQTLMLIDGHLENHAATKPRCVPLLSFIIGALCPLSPPHPTPPHPLSVPSTPSRSSVWAGGGKLGRQPALICTAVSQGGGGVKERSRQRCHLALCANWDRLKDAFEDAVVLVFHLRITVNFCPPGRNKLNT